MQQINSLGLGFFPYALVSTACSGLEYILGLPDVGARVTGSERNSPNR